MTELLVEAQRPVSHDLTGEPVVRHRALAEWVEEVAALTKPDAVDWCDGSEAEWDRLIDAAGRRRHADPARSGQAPEQLLCRAPIRATSPASRAAPSSAPNDESDAGPTNNWLDPAEMRAKLGGLFDGCMKGRTMYVVPFCMGPIGSDKSAIGVELTDSAYVVLSMRIMTRMGQQALDMLGEDGFFVRCVHSVGAPLAAGAEGRRRGRATTRSGSSIIPRRREIWSYGSGYGGNALLGKKCFALRIASVMARDEGWLAEHMLILKLTSPEGRSHYIAAAFPSRLRQDQSRDARADDARLEGRDGRRRHRLDALRRRRAAVCGQSRGRLLRRRARHRPGDQPQRGRDAARQRDLHQHRPDRGRRRLVGGADHDTAGRT